MSVSLTQQPPNIALSQSPMVYTVVELGDEITSSSYQYICELTYGRGDINVEPTTDLGVSTTYTLEKYPNESGYGMFDVSRILNSQFQQLVQFDKSQTVVYSATFYGRWLEGNTITTGSRTSVSGNKLALDGWLTPAESIYVPAYGYLPHWPILTSGPTTQSFQLNDYGNLEAIVTSDWNSSFSVSDIDGIKYVSNLGTETVSFTPTTSSYEIIQYVPIGQLALGWPSTLDGDGLEWFEISAVSGSTVMSEPIRFEAKCATKYDNIRVKWKNKFGLFDYFNFDLVSRRGFQTKTKEYRRQIGQWGATAMDSFHNEPTIQNYNTDVIQTISVNSDWVSEDYNNIFKELLVSDEIYFIEYENATPRLIPITIKTSNIQFKTEKVDKLIQYSFDFQYAQDYKLQF